MPYTYLIGWTKLDKWYYGVRYAKKCTPDDLWNPYKTSSKHIAQFIKEHGDPDSIRIARIFPDRKTACEHEIKFLKRVDAIKNPRFINRGIAGSYATVHDGMLGENHSKETRALMSQRNKERIERGWKHAPWTDEQRKAASERMKGVPKTPEHKAKLKKSCLIGVEAARKANLGKKRPEHTQFMKQYNAQHAIRYPTPKGNFRKFESPYTRDMLGSWCKSPDAVISKISITKLMKKNGNLVSYDWVGKTRREIGFSEPYFPIELSHKTF